MQIRIWGTPQENTVIINLLKRELADKMQLFGIDIDKNAIQRIECGKRFVTDIEIVAFAKVFNVCLEELLKK